MQINLVDEEFPTRVGCKARQLYYVLRQSECHSLGKEFNIPFKIQVHWCEVPLDTRRAWQETIAGLEDTHNGEWVRYDDKAIAQGEIEKLYTKSGLGGAHTWSRMGDLLGPSHLSGSSLKFNEFG